MNILGKLMVTLRVRSSARKMLKLQKSIWEMRQEYRQISANDFAWCDLGFYESLTEQITREGFTLLGDIEHISASRLMPDMRTFTRVFIGHEGKIRASIYHLKIQGPTRLKFHDKVPPDSYTIELESELMDGTFISTDNCEGKNLSDFPILKNFRFDPETSFDDLHAIHKRELERITSEHNVEAIKTETLEDILASWNRAHLIKGAYRRAHGYLSREQIIGMAGGQLTPLQLRLAEYEKLQMKDQLLHSKMK